MQSRRIWLYNGGYAFDSDRDVFFKAPRTYVWQEIIKMPQTFALLSESSVKYIIAWRRVLEWYNAMPYNQQTTSGLQI